MARACSDLEQATVRVLAGSQPLPDRHGRDEAGIDVLAAHAPMPGSLCLRGNERMR